MDLSAQENSALAEALAKKLRGGDNGKAPEPAKEEAKPAKPKVAVKAAPPEVRLGEIYNDLAGLKHAVYDLKKYVDDLTAACQNMEQVVMVLADFRNTLLKELGVVEPPRKLNDPRTPIEEEDIHDAEDIHEVMSSAYKERGGPLQG